MASSAIASILTAQPRRLTDFSLIADSGSMSLTGTSIAVSGGRLVITPTYSAEKLTDPGLEGNYTGGANDNLTTQGSGWTQSADVHGGAKAQQFIPGAIDHYMFQGAQVLAGGWAIGRVWTKRNAGTAGNVERRIVHQNTTALLGTSQLAYSTPKIETAAYDELACTGMSATSDSNVMVYIHSSGAAVFDTVTFDDMSIKAISTATMLALFPRQRTADMSVRAKWTIRRYCHAGVVAKVDSASDPQNMMLAVHDGNYGFTVAKRVAGQYTVLYSDTTTPYCTDAAIELRCHGTTVQAWYNGKQLGGDLTVSDAGIVNNLLFGLLSTISDNGCSAVELVPYHADTRPETWMLPVERNAGDIPNTVVLMKGTDALELAALGSYAPSAEPFDDLLSGGSGTRTRIVGNGATVSGADCGIKWYSKSYMNIDSLNLDEFDDYGLEVRDASYMDFATCTWNSTGPGGVTDGVKVIRSSNLEFTSCEVTELVSSDASCDGFECYDDCHDITFTNCIAHDILGGVATTYTHHGFEVYADSAASSGISFIGCESYNCHSGFSVEGGGSSIGSLGVVADACNSHDQTLYDYQGIQGSTITLRNGCIGSATNGNVVVEN